MKRLFAILLVLIFTTTVSFTFARDKSDDSSKKEQKEQEQQQEEVMETIQFTAAKTAINEMEFVIKADRLTFPNGRTVMCDEDTNFISASEGETVVQIAFPSVGFGGFNGLGGITVDGRITSEKSSETKKGNVTLRYSVMGSSISAQIFITLLHDSNEVNVDIEPNFSGDRLTVYGKIYPAGRSSVYQGASTLVAPTVR